MPQDRRSTIRWLTATRDPFSLLDTTILSNFAHVQRPDLVQTALEETAATTAVVMAELRRGEELGLVTRVDWAWLQLLNLTAAEQEQATHGWFPLVILC